MLNLELLLKASKKKHRQLTSYLHEFDNAPVVFHPEKVLKIKQSFFKVGQDLSVKKIEKKTVDKKKSLSNNYLFAKSLNVGYYLIIPLLLGIFLGNWLDSVFKTKPFFLLLLFTIGVVASFYNLWKISQETK